MSAMDAEAIEAFKVAAKALRDAELAYKAAQAAYAQAIKDLSEAAVAE